MANFVFSLREEDVSKRQIPKDRQASLEHSSFENSRESQKKETSMPVPAAYISKRRGPGEEDFSEEMNERIENILKENEVDQDGKIYMESFGSMMQDLGLLEDDDGEIMEEAFYGLDIDDNDTMNFKEFKLIAKRLNYKKK